MVGWLLHTIFGKALISALIFFVLSYGLFRKEGKNASQNGRWIGAFLSAAAIFNTPNPLGSSNADIVFRMILGGVMWFGVGFAVGFAWGHFRGNRKVRQADSVAELSAECLQPSSEHSNDAIWEKVYKEFDSDDRQLGLWAKCFAEAQGNENLAKSKYIKQRVEQLKAEDQCTSLLESEFRSGGSKIDTRSSKNRKILGTLMLLILAVGVIAYTKYQDSDRQSMLPEKFYKKGMVCTLLWNGEAFVELQQNSHVDNESYKPVAFGYDDAPSIRVLFPQSFTKKQMESVLQNKESYIVSTCRK